LLEREALVCAGVAARSDRRGELVERANAPE